MKLAPKLSENTTTTVKNKNTLLTSLVPLCLAEYSQLQQAKKKKKKVPFRCFSLDSACGCSSPPLGFSLLSSGRIVPASPALLQLSCGGCLAAIYRPLKRSGGGGHRDPRTLSVCANQVALLHLLRPLLNVQHFISFFSI